MNQQQMTHQQFIGALQSLHLPLYGAGEVFQALDVDNSGYVDIREFCDAMVQGPATQKQPARTAGTDMIGSKPPLSDRAYERTGTLPPMPPDERGYTPLRAPGQTA